MTTATSGARCAQPLAHLQPGQPGQHEVEHDEVGAGPGGDGQRGGAVGGVLDLEAGVRQVGRAPPRRRSASSSTTSTRARHGRERRRRDRRQRRSCRRGRSTSVSPARGPARPSVRCRDPRRRPPRSTSSCRASTRRPRCPSCSPGCRPAAARSSSTTARADGSADVASAHGALVVAEPRRGFGDRLRRGAGRGHRAEWSPSATRTARSTCADLPAVVGPVAGGAGRPRARPAACPSGRGAWPLHARLANRALARRAAAGAPAPRCTTSARCAPPGARRCSSSACGTGARATPWRRCCARRRRAGGSRRSTCRTGRGSAGRRSPGRCGAPWTAVADMRRVLAEATA